jgi:putative nucleotidyltransferase with HDIG domain
LAARNAQLEELLPQVVSILKGQGVVTYLAGGFLRNALLGLPSNDVDLAVVGNPFALARLVADALGGHYVLLDEVLPTARVVFQDASDDAGIVYFDFCQFRGDDILADLAQRDFTINALALDLSPADVLPALSRLAAGALATLPLLDPFGGLADLRAGLVRAVHDGVFQDDPLRLLRAVRFVAQLGFQIEPHTQALIRRHSALAARPAAERILEEIVKILSAPGAGEHLRLLESLGLLTVVIPELNSLRGVTQPQEHYWDVFEHSLQTVSAAERLVDSLQNPHSALPRITRDGRVGEKLRAHFAEVLAADRPRTIAFKLAALLHDVAKPQTRSVEPDGRIRFINHQIVGLPIVEGILRRLRLSRREIAVILTVIEHHLRPGQLTDEATVSKRAVYRFFRDTGAEGIDVLFLSLADHWATRGPLLNADHWARHVAMTQAMLTYYLAPEPAAAPVRLVTGDDILALGVPSGPRVGELLDQVREAQAAGEVRNREEALAFARVLIRTHIQDAD